MQPEPAPPGQIRLVLLPGLDGTGRLFARLLPHLPPWIDPIVVSYPAQVAHSYDELDPLVAKALPPSGPFILLAESFSGPLGVMTAAREPHGLRGIVLVASFAHFPARALRFARPLIGGWTMKAAPCALRDRLLLGANAEPSLRAEVDGAIASVPPGILAARARDVLGVDVRRELAAVRVPLLYLAATADALVSAESWRLIESIVPGARLVSVAGPHLILQASPRECACAIASFAEGLRL